MIEPSAFFAAAFLCRAGAVLWDVASSTGGGGVWLLAIAGLATFPDGAIDRVIEMPVSNVTTCTFGGPDLMTLYVTSAGLGTPPGERFGGGLFTIETNIQGQPENRFRAFRT